jgi:Ca-activated chloride channel family protein
MTFSEPLYLLLLIPALAWLFWVARRMHGLARGRKRLALGLRTVVLGLLILALAGMETVRPNKGVSTIFVLDHSASMKPEFLTDARAFIGKSLDALGPDDRAGLVVFGKDPVIDVNTGSLRTLGKIYANPNPSSTDIAAALRLASAAFGEGTAKRIVLLSDANETDGAPAEAAEVAATDDIQIDYVKPDAMGGRQDEVVVDDLVLPNSVTKGEPFTARVTAEATTATSGTLRLDRDGVPVAEVPVHLTPGTNSLVVSQTAGQPGFYCYRAVLTADRDTDVRNNVGMGFVSVKGRPRVLLLEGTPGTGQALAQALQAHDLDVKRAGPEALPTRPEDLQGYDSVILSDFPAEMMTPPQMTLIASAVRDSGIGFGMVGGENSFLPGGYYETPIADALAVDLNVRQRKTFPSTTIVIVLDTSGSMGMIEDGQEKVKIAASAAAATVRMMNVSDYIGVAGSTDDISFVAPIQHPTDKDAIAARIGQMDVGGGGIYIRPSLEFADKALTPVSTKVRHLILMADGNDADEQEGALDRAREMVAKDMTISVVAIGTGKDVPFLKQLAAVGKGSFYLADHANQLQRLFTRDASMMTRSAIEEGAFLPKVDPGDEVLRGLNLRSMPPLYAYDLTSDRPLSRVPMRTAKDDPLLAFWQYGLGTSMAFTSDAQPKWARQWMGWSDFNSFWTQTIRSTLRHASNNRLQVTARREGGKGVIEVQAFDPSGNPINNLAAKVRVLDPDGHGQDVTISQQGPGRYTGDFEASGAGSDAGTGSYIVSVAESHGTGAPLVTRAGFSVAYPPEYQAVGPNLNLLAQLAKTTGGKALAQPLDAFRSSVRPGQSVRDLWPLLLLAAALLFPLDIAVRRVVLPIAEAWAAILAWLRRRRPAAATVPATASMARLHQAKQQVSGTPGPNSAPPETLTPSPDRPPRPGTAPVPPPASTAPLSTTQRLLDAKRRQQK